MFALVKAPAIIANNNVTSFDGVSIGKLKWFTIDNIDMISRSFQYVADNGLVSVSVKYYNRILYSYSDEAIRALSYAPGRSGIISGLATLGLGALAFLGTRTGSVAADLLLNPSPLNVGEDEAIRMLRAEQGAYPNLLSAMAAQEMGGDAFSGAVSANYSEDVVVSGISPSNQFPSLAFEVAARADTNAVE
ncbi:hypothetical protein, partial [Xanthobacter agilis]